jgi:hypothetical protein
MFWSIDATGYGIVALTGEWRSAAPGSLVPLDRHTGKKSAKVAVPASKSLFLSAGTSLLFFLSTGKA